MADYIEREAAIAAIMSEPPDAHYPHWYADKIRAIPSADVAPVRHGWWEKAQDMRRMDGNIYDYRCSLCDSLAEKGVYNNYDRLTNYCPSCGAKMDLEDSQCDT